MFGINGAELFIIAALALFLFGPDKIPEIAKTVKKALAMYTEARDQVTEVVSTQILSPEEMEMLKDPLGMNKLKGSVDSILSPERLNLINQGGQPSAQRFSPASAGSGGVRPLTDVAATSDADSIWASLGAPDDKGSDDAN